MKASDILLRMDYPFKHLEVWRADDGTVCVDYPNIEFKTGNGFLTSDWGKGSNFEEACNDYYRKICGKTLVANAGGSSRVDLYFAGIVGDNE